MKRVGAERTYRADHRKGTMRNGTARKGAEKDMARKSAERKYTERKPVPSVFGDQVSNS
jgi:hypothetical protein